MIDLLKITKNNIFCGFKNLNQPDFVLYQYSTTFNSRLRWLLDILIDLKYLSVCYKKIISLSGVISMVMFTECHKKSKF